MHSKLFSRPGSLVIILLILLGPLGAAAQSVREPYRAAVRGLSGVDTLIPQAPLAVSTQRHRPARLQLAAMVPGVGRVLLRFDRQRLPAVQPQFSDGLRYWNDPKGVTLLQGSASSSVGTIPAAAAIFESGGQQRLFASFIGSRRLSAAKDYYQLEILLLAGKEANVARISRVSQRGTGHISCNGPITLPPAALISVEQSAAVNPSVTGQSPETVPSTTKRELDLALYGEKPWYDHHGSNSNAVISTIVNAAETIYENQLNLVYRIGLQTVYTNRTFGSTEAEDKLANFNSAVDAKTVGGKGSGDVYHLFTAQDLAGDVIGLAYQINDSQRGTVCRYPQYSFGLSQYTNLALTQLTFAHEVGHNLSAIHPEEDLIRFPSPPPSSLMTGYAPANPNDPAVRRFSTYSVSQINSYVSSYNSCLKVVATPELPDDGDPGDGGGTPGDGDGGTPGDGSGSNPGGDSGGGSGGSITNPGGGTVGAPSVELKATLDRQGQLLAQVTLESAEPSCTLRLRAATRRDSLSFGTVLAATPANHSEIFFQAALPRKAVPPTATEPRTRVFLGAELYCPTKRSGYSPGVLLRPHLVRSRRPALPVPRWLRLLQRRMIS